MLDVLNPIENLDLSLLFSVLHPKFKFFLSLFRIIKPDYRFLYCQSIFFLFLCRRIDTMGSDMTGC